ncbi:pilus assembly protein TadG-related protein [Ammoniphilus sp. 3BR4]|uniref:pilus assembly protein TadG-related protein n=1 Tax=Ammoniphilus sp. 3BR4 TaxID=3158265 RepID=UPI003465D39C
MKWLKDETGAVAAFLAIIMTLLLGFVALAIDGGLLYQKKASLQRSLDAAVLAGIQELPSFPDEAREEAAYTAEVNGLDPSKLQTNFNLSNTRMEARATEDQEFFFAKAIGFHSASVAARAAAELNPLTSGKGAVPLGVEYTTNLAFGTQVRLKVGDSTVGNFGALALTGPGARNYETDLKEGFLQYLSVGAILNTETGNMAGPTERAVNYRRSLCPFHGTATYQDYPSDCPNIVLVPVYKAVSIQSNQIKQVEVVGFASFFLEGMNSSDEVVGRFIQFVHEGATSPVQANYGTYGAKLAQ